MSELPERWDPRQVALTGDKEREFLLRPGQILVGPGDAADVAKVLTGWKVQDRRTFGVTTFTRTPANPDDPAKEVLDAIARVRRSTAKRPQGPVRVAPNHVLVGESAITLTGEPRVQGGPGLDRARRDAAEGAPAAHHPQRRRQGRPDRRARHRPLHPPVARRRAGARPTPPTSGTSTTTTTPTPSPATARSSPA